MYRLGGRGGLLKFFGKRLMNQAIVFGISYLKSPAFTAQKNSQSFKGSMALLPICRSLGIGNFQKYHNTLCFVFQNFA